MSERWMFCEECSVVHEHPIPKSKGVCLCTFSGHKVRDATEEEMQTDDTYEQRLFGGINKALKAYRDA